MKIAIGGDPNASALKTVLMAECGKLGHEVVDFGHSDDIYANTAIRVAEDVAAGRCDRGVLVCGTGIGVSIAANKVKGAYAALLADVYSAQRAQLSNNANIACFGAFTLGEKLAVELLKTWLGLSFDEASPSAPKVARYKEYDAARG
ncbi:MAG: RpiB/LacA/LacB family sugar-phosphate isomerase [Clostridiales Family XIII bacterium]|jgi:ribose 5-phosphate isomerase B|nr:RpiB/LacA/LacB family sugar-phosphate isomerase [Clostridiales Family XIII bacterium]